MRLQGPSTPGPPRAFAGSVGSSCAETLLSTPPHTVTRSSAHLPRAWLLRAAIREPVPMVTLSVPRGPTWLLAARLRQGMGAGDPSPPIQHTWGCLVPKVCSNSVSLNLTPAQKCSLLLPFLLWGLP